jgi:cytochrome P450
MKLVLISIITIIMVIIASSRTVKTTAMVFLIVMRGILSPNCAWWNISDLLLEDSSGIDLYFKLRKEYGITPVPLNFINTRVWLITDKAKIRFILNNSPTLFGAGRLKYDMFKSFMPKNLGISQGCPWIKRRALNEHVLSTGNPHPLRHIFQSVIREELDNLESLPTTYSEFKILAQRASGRIIFGEYIPSDIFQIFIQANSISSVVSGNTTIDPRIKNLADAYFRQAIRKRSPSQATCLMDLIVDGDISEITDQIPHWIFPIVGIYLVNIPRMLTLMCHHPETFRDIDNQLHQRHLILETFRLNNPVVTTFRTARVPVIFDNQQYPVGTQFVILNNPVLRDSQYFNDPDKFIPDRWYDLSEDDYHVLMFNQGPQRCPGKDLTIVLMSDFLDIFVERLGNRMLISNFQLDRNKIPQMINPCALSFSFLEKG